MKGLTLDYCKDVKISDLWLGTAVFRRSADTPKDVLDELNVKHEEVLLEDPASKLRKLATERGMSVKDADELMDSIYKGLFNFYAIPMFLLKTEDGRYYSLSDGTLDPDDAERIEFLEPFSDYYSEFKFVIYNRKVCVDVKSGEPFETYCQKIEKYF